MPAVHVLRRAIVAPCSAHDDRRPMARSWIRRPRRRPVCAAPGADRRHPDPRPRHLPPGTPVRLLNTREPPAWSAPAARSASPSCPSRRRAPCHRAERHHDGMPPRGLHHRLSLRYAATLDVERIPPRGAHPHMPTFALLVVLLDATALGPPLHLRRHRPRRGRESCGPATPAARP